MMGEEETQEHMDMEDKISVRGQNMHDNPQPHSHSHMVGCVLTYKRIALSGSVVYGSGPMTGEEETQQHMDMEDKIFDLDSRRLFTTNAHAELFSEVGGVEAWKERRGNLVS